MVDEKIGGFTPEVWIYVYEDNHKVLYDSENGFDFDNYKTKDVFINIAEILVETKLPFKSIFWVGFYYEKDFQVGIERAGDLVFEEDSMKTFLLDPNEEIINVRNELILFFSNLAGEFINEAEAFQKKANKKNQEFMGYFRVINQLVMFREN